MYTPHGARAETYKMEIDVSTSPRQLQFGGLPTDAALFLSTPPTLLLCNTQNLSLFM